MKKLTLHPTCELFPLLSKEELRQLTAGLTPLQEGQLYYNLSMQVNPATGQKWKLMEIARHFAKPYSQVRNRWALVIPYKADWIRRKGESARKKYRLTNEERLSLERRDRTLTEVILQETIRIP